MLFHSYLQSLYLFNLFLTPLNFFEKWVLVSGIGVNELRNDQDIWGQIIYSNVQNSFEQVCKIINVL